MNNRTQHWQRWILADRASTRLPPGTHGANSPLGAWEKQR